MHMKLSTKTDKRSYFLLTKNHHRIVFNSKVTNMVLFIYEFLLFRKCRDSYKFLYLASYIMHDPKVTDTSRFSVSTKSVRENPIKIQISCH